MSCNSTKNTIKKHNCEKTKSVKFEKTYGDEASGTCGGEQWGKFFFKRVADIQI